MEEERLCGFLVITLGLLKESLCMLEQANVLLDGRLGNLWRQLYRVLLHGNLALVSLFQAFGG